jgi:hypothetical protein
MREPQSHKAKLAKKRAAARLDWHLEKRLLSYAAAATAAGVAALACPPQAQAKVVFTDTWIPITPASAKVTLDLNNDGIADFQISNIGGSCVPSYALCVTMKVQPQNGSNAIWGTHASASALGSGVRLGSPGKFQPGHEFMGQDYFVTSKYGKTNYRSAGPWGQTTRGFLGLKFIIQGQVHYGWARLSVSATTRGMYAAISGYAYETEPNKPIRTGQENGDARKKSQRGKNGHVSPVASTPASTPSGLGMLAGGAPALKRRESETQLISSEAAQ